MSFLGDPQIAAVVKLGPDSHTGLFSVYAEGSLFLGCEWR
jgi:hypothetical protein